MANENPPGHWNEDTSKRFLDYGRYFVPAREQQMRMMVDLLKDLPEPITVLELGCGEGLLAEILLDERRGASYVGLDGSSVMLEKARDRLARFGERASLHSFELADRSWRVAEVPLSAVVSSLVIHHLDATGKQLLYGDLYPLLAEGGVFIIADMIEPASTSGRRIAADAWDDVVRQRSIELDGTTAGLDFFLQEGWNTYRYVDPDDIDHPSGLFDQLKWLEQAGFVDLDVHFFQAGHALFSAWKR